MTSLHPVGGGTDNRPRTAPARRPSCGAMAESDGRRGTRNPDGRVAQVLGDNCGVSYGCTACGHSWS
ncbi:hypothetical protein [Streptomyces sp. NPDC058671]|uniref:hypothetical protein n=1 Tax=unclassified Streptomyces TaxID=2593676 RepID=UPI0036688957